MVSGASGPESVHLHEVWNPVRLGNSKVSS